MTKKNLAILLFEQVEVLDFAGPFEVFSVANELHDYGLFNVFTVSHHTKSVNAVNGLKVMPDFDFNSCPAHIDYLVIPGGNGSKLFYNDHAYKDWVAKHYKSATAVLTICSGSRFLAPLGLLDNVAFCTHQEVYPSIAEIAPNAMPQQHLRYITDQKLTSAGGISSGIDAAFHVLLNLTNEEVCAKTAKYMEYFRNPAECSGYWR